jgi:hypothetical protein
MNFMAKTGQPIMVGEQQPLEPPYLRASRKRSGLSGGAGRSVWKLFQAVRDWGGINHGWR